MLDSMQNIPTIQAGCVDVKVNQFYNQLCDAIHQCVKSCSGKVKKPPTVKSWWNANCKSARTRNRLFHYIWKSSGRPVSGVIYDCYKSSKKTYRQCCRSAIHSRSNQKTNLIS